MVLRGSTRIRPALERSSISTFILPGISLTWMERLKVTTTENKRELSTDDPLAMDVIQ